MAYEAFSEIYDKFMNNIDYEQWVCYIEEIWQKFGLKPELVADLACGTGNITIPLSQKGYDMIGVDISPDMLMQARLKAGSDSGILFLEQDMRSFELYGTVDCCLCMVDGLNYILEEDELLQVFKLAHNYLNPNGMFIFDLNTIYKFQHILGDNSFCETDEDAAIIWENCYDDETFIHEYYVNMFIETEDGLYERYEEAHYQRGYPAEVIIKLLNAAGFEIAGIFNPLTFDNYSDTSEKMVFAVIKK
ncbi:class I SAM-dependent methyltransferase [Tyzzerella sp. OttesenSCG-928-J15]|nr:class I SAM-dependent methyltransferase [Tyzzerella sp. OttesenSCG-928-J15]